MNFIYAVVLGVAIAVIGQLLVDWVRHRNAAVPRDEFEEAMKLLYRIKSAVEIETGITINGIDYRKLRKPPEEE